MHIFYFLLAIHVDQKAEVTLKFDQPRPAVTRISHFERLILMMESQLEIYCLRLGHVTS